MTRLSSVLLQILIAAVAGYGGARYALDHAQPEPAPPRAEQQQLPNAIKPAPPPPGAPAMAGNSAAAALSVSYRTAVERAAPSVVTVHSARTASRGPFGLGGRQLLAQGLGSGVVLDREGYIVTNYHVVADANELAIALPDGSLRKTRLIGADPDSDLAVIRVENADLQPIAIGDIKDAAVGDVVLAVGNPLGVGQTVTQGIISAMGRKGIGINPVENFIQTDAAINPGNSGGALIDTAGRLIGINSAILSRGGGSEGIGFAIPIDLAQKVVASIKKQ
ncbi:MAG: trypsin-like peptidase domain-containing protein, partial [Casimicrobiaceae bacterium]